MTFGFEEQMHRLQQRLQMPLPGKQAHARMAPPGRLRDAYYQSSLLHYPRRSAVLVLLFPVQDAAHTLLIRRAAGSGPHSRQIGFPGGSLESGDADFTAAALREAREELSLKAERLQVLGLLTPVFIPVSDQVVVPVLACSSSRPQVQPCRSEVDYVVEVNCADLFVPELRRSGPFISGSGKTIVAPYYSLSGEQVWGATALMLSELADLLAG